jgi:alpha-1,2-mannosyltransferase
MVAKMRPRRLAVLGATAFALSVGILVGADLILPRRMYMLDLRVYRWGAMIALHSGNLYGSHYGHYHLLFTYPPLAALAFAALAAIPLSVMTWSVTAASVLSLTLTMWLTWGALGYRRPAVRIGATLATAAVALWLQPVLQTIYFGQVNLVLMLLVVADLCLPDRSRLKGAGTGLAAGLKLTPLIFIPYLLLTRRIRAALVAAAVFAATIVVSLILLPGPSRQYWLGGLFLDARRTGNPAYVGNQSLMGLLARLLGSAAAARPYWLAVAVLAGAAGLLLAARADRRGQPMAGILICALTGLLVSPVSWAHHWVWMAPALAVAVAQAARLRGPAWRRLACWSGVAALAALFALLPQGLVPGYLVQGAGLDGLQQLTASLYLAAGLILAVSVFIRRGRPPGSAADAGQPGSQPAPGTAEEALPLSA